MSSTLTWASSGLATKTGATAQTYLDDLDTLVTSKSGDATFSWQKAGKNTATSPYWLLLSRKDGSNGRIALIIYNPSTTGNAAIFDTSPTGNQINLVWFPNGTANTLSNLTSASGTICGNDTGAVKAATTVTVFSLYAALFQLWYFDSYDGIVFGSGNPATSYAATSTHFMQGVGDLLVDAADVAYGCAFANCGLQTAQQLLSGWYIAQGMPWQAGTAAIYPAGSCGNWGYVRTNYGTANKLYFPAYSAAGWGAMAVGSTDILSDASNTKAWFVPMQLVGQTKGEGFVLKFRQIGLGPGTTTAFAPYNSTGPVVQARQFNCAAAGALGYPWFTNFKL